MPAPKQPVTRLRQMLDRMVAARKLSGDEQERIHEQVAAEVETFPRQGILEAFDLAAGRSQDRRLAMLYLLDPFADLPGVEARLNQWLSDPEARVRDQAIQIIGIAKLHSAAPLLNGIMLKDESLLCRCAAINAAGWLRSPVNLETLFLLAEQRDPKLEATLVITLQRFATEACRPFLQRVFDESPADREARPQLHGMETLLERSRLKSRRSNRMFAAWGLAKLGDEQALSFLIAMLRDPVKEGPNFRDPGESIRAAQAVSDIFGWPFEWGMGSVPGVIRRVAEELGR